MDIVNGFPGHELKFGDRKLVGTYLRVGLMTTAAWRTFKVRQDFAAAAKIQTEDDISASVVVPGKLPEAVPYLAKAPGASHQSVGASSSSTTASTACSSAPTTRCIAAWTSRPSSTWSRGDNFISNFEPLAAEPRQGDGAAKVTEFDQFTQADAAACFARRAAEGNGLRGLLGPPAHGRRKAQQEPALSADPP